MKSEGVFRSLFATNVLHTVISGGQTGADWAALEAAHSLGYDTGGAAPMGYLTAAGCRRRELKSFGLVEMKSASYPDRSRANVDNADATVVFRVRHSAGTDKTIGYAISGQWKTIELDIAADTWQHSDGRSPVIVIAKMTKTAGRNMRRFLIRHGVAILNVAGHRSESLGDKWQTSVRRFLSEELPRK